MEINAYARAGVSVAAGDRAVELMRADVRATQGLGVLETATTGGFAGLYDLGFATQGMRRPLLATSTDGVGTKVDLARRLRIWDTVGYDLVGMVVDDLVAAGVRPLFMTDYIACGRVDPERVAALVRGVARACQEVECALIAGETAEHPGLLGVDEFDIAGAATGVVDAPRLLGPARVCAGDVLVGFASSGLHSNGYSLVRRIVDGAGAGWDTVVGDEFGGSALPGVDDGFGVGCGGAGVGAGSVGAGGATRWAGWDTVVPEWVRPPVGSPFALGASSLGASRDGEAGAEREVGGIGSTGGEAGTGGAGSAEENRLVSGSGAAGNRPAPLGSGCEDGGGVGGTGRGAVGSTGDEGGGAAERSDRVAVTSQGVVAAGGGHNTAAAPVVGVAPGDTNNSGATGNAGSTTSAVPASADRRTAAGAASRPYTLGLACLEPTRLYSRLCLELENQGCEAAWYAGDFSDQLDGNRLHAFAHVTGGGLAANLARVIPAGLHAVVNRGSWPVPGLFKFLMQIGGLQPGQVEDAWNLGIGMVAVVHPDFVMATHEAAAAHGIESFEIGRVDDQPPASAQVSGARTVCGTKGIAAGAVTLHGSYCL